MRWRATGTNLSTEPTCDFTSVPEATKVSFTYDLRNRLKDTGYGDGYPAVNRTYTPDGLLETVQSNGSTWKYRYNNRRLLDREQLLQNWESGEQGWKFTRIYDALGHVRSFVDPFGGPTCPRRHS